MSKLVEAEYRFDRVIESEREKCLNWEYHREVRRHNKLPAPQPWLKLNLKEKSSYRNTCFVDFFSKRKLVAINPPEIYGSKVVVRDGSSEALHSCEFINLPILVDWESSQTALMEDFNLAIAEWVKQQRRDNPSAKYYNNKYKLGRPRLALDKLCRLAIWRLHRLEGLESESKIENRLTELLSLLALRGTDDEAERSDIKREKRGIPVPVNECLGTI